MIRKVSIYCHNSGKTTITLLTHFSVVILLIFFSRIWSFVQNMTKSKPTWESPFYCCHYEVVPKTKSLFKIIHFSNLVFLQSMLTFEMQNLVSLKSYRNIFSFSEGRIFLLFTHDFFFFCFNQRFFREMTNDVDWKTRSILPCSISLRKRSKQFFFSFFEYSTTHKHKHGSCLQLKTRFLLFSAKN